MPKAAFALAAVLLAAAGAARSEPVTFNIGAASDYEFRGISQTRRHAEAFGGVDADIGSLGYVGGWASNVDFGEGARAEYDLYGGVRPKLGPVTVDLGVVRYGYAGGRSTRRSDFTELKVAPSMQLGPATFGVAWFHAQDLFGRLGPANYIEANASLPLGASPFSLSGAIGRQQQRDQDDYTTWNLGVGYALNRRLGFDLRYWDTDSHNLGGVYRATIVLSLKATFP
jgi:uncharacterized protein (TIGR02001 family)